MRNPKSFEAINPAVVGNHRLLGVDDASIVKSEMSELGLYTLDKEDVAKQVLTRMRELEAFGCKFEDAKASLHLLILESLGYAIWPFQVTKWETSTSRSIDKSSSVVGTIEVSVGAREGSYEKTLTATERGVGPIHAIDLALKKCLEQEFPEVRNLKLISYSLNIVDSLSGTAATARARTEFTDEDANPHLSDHHGSWATTAVSEDVLDASIKALIDGYRYKLDFPEQGRKISPARLAGCHEFEVFRSMMRQTIVEKIVSRAVGRKVEAGEHINVLPIDKLYFNEVIAPPAIINFQDDFQEVFDDAAKNSGDKSGEIAVWNERGKAKSRCSIPPESASYRITRYLPARSRSRRASIS